MRHYLPFNSAELKKLEAASGLISPKRREAFSKAVRTRLDGLDSYSPADFNTVLRDTLSHFGVSVNVRSLNNKKEQKDAHQISR